VPPELIAFVGVAAVVIVAPGPDTALTIRNALLGGRLGGTFTALGVVTGQAVWIAATSAGLAALLHAWQPAFVALRLAGAAYLVFLGARALYAGVTGGGGSHLAADVARPAGRLRWAAYRQGALSNLGNPKMAVFFMSLLPQFVPSGHTTFLALFALGLLFSSMTLVWLTAYSVAVARIGGVLRRPRVRRALDAVTGAVLVGLGLRLATERA
jgi:threonine/homoserine/homoserine lactone efflux protein